MLRRQRWGLGELTEAVGLAEREVNGALAVLREAGLVTPSADREGEFRAVEPCLALPAVAARRMKARDGDGPAIPLAAHVIRFIALHERTAEQDAQRRMTGLDGIGAVVERLSARVEHRISFLVPAYSPDSFEVSGQIAEAAVRRGAAYRAVWSRSMMDTDAAEHARWLDARSVAPRVVDAVPTRAVIVDESVAVVLSSTGAIRLVRSAEVLADLVSLADRLWSQGSPASGGTAPRGTSASRPRSEVILRLLAEGLTDDAVARRIGVSVRTVRNEVASAMSVLDARSRFQAGARAAQMGLI